MMNEKPTVKNDSLITRLVFSGLMAAIVCVITIFRIPLGQSKVHFANSMCLLSGLLLGPVWGGTSAGLGSAIYDVAMGGYSFFDALITFVSKFAMAWVTGFLFNTWTKKRKGKEADFVRDRVSGAVPKSSSGQNDTEEKTWQENLIPLIASCVLGALTYVALYMLKSWLFKLYVEPVPPETIPAVLVAKLIPSLINAAFAAVTAPIFYHAVMPALKAAGVLRRLGKETDFVRERVSEAATKSSSGQNGRRELPFTEETDFVRERVSEAATKSSSGQNSRRELPFTEE